MKAAERNDAEWVPIDSIEVDPKNVRQHDDRNLQTIANSLKGFGQQKPIVVLRESRTVIAGSGTLLAARSLGWKQIWVSWSDLDDLRARAYGVVDNRTTDLSDWDYAQLGPALKEFQDLGLDLPELGWEPHEFGPLMEADFLPKPTPLEDHQRGDGEGGGTQQIGSVRMIGVTEEQWDTIQTIVGRHRETVGCRPEDALGRVVTAILESFDAQQEAIES